MALGGGSFISQNKVLPGTYINFISAVSAHAELSERGIVTMPFELDWGVESEVFTVTSSDFQKNSMKFFGYDYANDRMKGIRDLFKKSHTLYAYRLNTDGEKAANDFATAKYPGIRGNDLKTIIQVNADNENMFDVKTYFGTVCVDRQTVISAADLNDNDYVMFKKEATLVATAATPFLGGTNGSVNGTSYQAYLDKIESYSYNAMGVVTTDDTVLNLFAAFNRRLRDEMGIKFQLVLYRKAADFMGTINVKNKVTNAGWSEASLVYWLTGVAGGTAVNKSAANMRYDGEFSVDTNYTQIELQNAIKAGEFMLHKVNSEIRVLIDNNSMVTVSDTCGDVFKDNQIIRVIDQLANDDAVLFNTKYLGTVPNNDAGRTSLWSDLVKIRRVLLELGAIENFKDTDVAVEAGDTKKSVVVTSEITPTNAMSTLYMTITVA